MCFDKNKKKRYLSNVWFCRKQAGHHGFPHTTDFVNVNQFIHFLLYLTLKHGNDPQTCSKNNLQKK